MNKFILSSAEQCITIKRYSDRFKKFGYSPKSLGWDKGKQEVRFQVLTSQYDFTSKTVLDIGCGFGDLSKFLSINYKDNYQYFGIDLVPDLINQAKSLYKNNKINFILGDFLSLEINEEIDFV